MMQSRTHTCGQLRIENAGEHVTLVGWMENVRVVGNNFAFIVLRDFYGTTQIVVETSELLAQIKGYNKESTISVEGTVRERASKNPNQPTGDIEVVPEKIELLEKAGFRDLRFAQTLTTHPLYSNRQEEQPSEGYEKGDYVAVPPAITFCNLQRLF